MVDPVNAEQDEGLETAIVPSVVEAQERAAIDIQVATARRYPRTIKAFQADLETWALATPDIATECFYVLERQSRNGGTTRIIGPSVRFAELILAAYKNLAVDVRLESDDGSRVVVVAVARDMERNVAQRVPVTRRVTGRDGRRYSDDMVNVTIQAAASIAKRNAIMGVVPKALWSAVMEKAKALARGDAGAKSIVERIDDARKAWGALGVKDERLLGFIGKASWKDVTADDLLGLIVTYREVKAGERDVDSIHAPEPEAPAAKEAATGANEAVAAAAKRGRKATAPASPTTGGATSAPEGQKPAPEAAATTAGEQPKAERGAPSKASPAGDVPAGAV